MSPVSPHPPLARVWLRLAIVGACLGAVVGPATVAHADVRTEARRHFRRGMDLIAAERYVEGIAELEEAYATLPHPNVLYNLGRAHYELGNLDAAIDNFERYLESEPPDRADVEVLVADLRARLAEREARRAARASSGEATPDVDALTALEATAAETARLARESGDPTLVAQADRLSAQAAALREATPDEGATADEPPATSLEDVGESRGDVYEERVVSASRVVESPLDAPNSTTIVTEQDIRLSGLSGMVPLGELLRRVAGVEVMTLGPSVTDVAVRGLNQRLSNKILVLVDGRSVFLDFIGATLWNLIPVAAEDVERIEVIRGPASAVYGADAFTGVINIITRRPGEGRSYVTAGGGNGETLHGAAAATARVGDVGLRVAGGYDRTDQWALEFGPGRVDLQPFADDPNLAIERGHVRGELSWTSPDRWQLDAGAGLTVADTAFYGIGRFRQLFGKDVLFAQTHAGVRSPVGLGVRTFWNAFRADVGFAQVEPGALPTTSTVDTHVVDVEADWTGEAELGFTHQITIGAGYRFKYVDWDWIGDDERQNHFNVYAQDAMQVTDWLRLQISARLDRHPLLDELQFSPRGTVVLRPSEGSSIRATVGRAFRSPTFLESYLDLRNPTPVRGVTALAAGNRSLDPERITSFELGFASQDLEVLSVELNAYYNWVDDLVGLSEITPFGRSDYGSGGGVSYDEGVAAYPLGELQFANQRSRLRQIGGEVGARLFPVDGLDVYANYSVHDTRPEGDGQDLDDVLAADQRTSLHKVNAGVQYRAPFGLDVSVDVHWLSQQIWVEQVTDVTTGVRFEAFELPAYVLLNARVGWRFLDDGLEVAVSGFNLLDQGRRQHPFGQPMDLRVLGTVTGRFGGGEP